MRSSFMRREISPASTVRGEVTLGSFDGSRKEEDPPQPERTVLFGPTTLRRSFVMIFTLVFSTWIESMSPFPLMIPSVKRKPRANSSRPSGEVMAVATCLPLTVTVTGTSSATGSVASRVPFAPILVQGRSRYILCPPGDGPDRAEEPVHVLYATVAVEGCPYRPVGKAEVRHEGHAAVVAGPHHDVGLLVEEMGDFVRVKPPHRERDHPDPLRPRPGSVDLHPADSPETLEHPPGQGLLVPPHHLHSQGLQVIDGPAEADGAADVRGPPLVPGVTLGEGVPRCGHPVHGPPAEEEGFDPGASHPEGAGSRGAEHLVAREAEEVAAQGLHVHGDVGNRLGAVHEEECPVIPADRGDLGDRDQVPQHIRGMGD